MSENELAVEISKSATDSSTFSAVTLDARFDTLLHRVNKWASALVRGLSDRPVQIHEVYDVNTNHAKFGQAFRSTKHFASYETEKDLYDLASNVWDLGIKERYGIEDEKLKATSKAVLDAVTGVVLHERHSGAEKGAHGLTIYHISCAFKRNGRPQVLPKPRLLYGNELGQLYRHVRNGNWLHQLIRYIYLNPPHMY